MAGKKSRKIRHRPHPARLHSATRLAKFSAALPVERECPSDCWGSPEKIRVVFCEERQARLQEETAFAGRTDIRQCERPLSPPSSDTSERSVRKSRRAI